MGMGKVFKRIPQRMTTLALNQAGPSYRKVPYVVNC